jgi:hypothetical protein
MNLHSYAHLIFDKLDKNMQQRKYSISTNVVVESEYLPAEHWN